MHIKCPHCQCLGTVTPDNLLGRIYVCTHCHRMLHLAPDAPEDQRWQPLATAATEDGQVMPLRRIKNA